MRHWCIRRATKSAKNKCHQKVTMCSLSTCQKDLSNEQWWKGLTGVFLHHFSLSLSFFLSFFCSESCPFQRSFHNRRQSHPPAKILVLSLEPPMLFPKHKSTVSYRLFMSSEINCRSAVYFCQKPGISKHVRSCLPARWQCSHFQYCCQLLHSTRTLNPRKPAKSRMVLANHLDNLEEPKLPPLSSFQSKQCAEAGVPCSWCWHCSLSSHWHSFCSRDAIENREGQKGSLLWMRIVEIEKKNFHHCGHIRILIKKNIDLGVSNSSFAGICDRALLVCLTVIPKSFLQVMKMWCHLSFATYFVVSPPWIKILSWEACFFSKSKAPLWPPLWQTYCEYWTNHKRENFKIRD